MTSPTPDDVREARHAAGLSQSQAALLVDGTMRGWQGYEAAERRMSPGLWRLFRARAALLRGDERAALEALREGIAGIERRGA